MSSSRGTRRTRFLKGVPSVDSPQVRRGERDDDATTPLHDPARLLRVLAARARLDNAATAEATAATALMPRARLLPLPWRTSWPGRLALPRHPPGAAAWSKRPLGRAPARPLCLLRARLAALPLPRVLEPAASKAADVSAVDHTGALRGRRGQGAAAHGLHDGGRPGATCYSLLTTCCSLLATHHAPRTTHHAPRTTHHAPLTTHRPMARRTRSGGTRASSGRCCSARASRRAAHRACAARVSTPTARS